MIYLEEGTKSIQILAFSVLARVCAPVPCLHDQSLRGGGPGGGRAGGSRIMGLGCAGSLKSWVLLPVWIKGHPTGSGLKERLCWGQSGLCLSQEDFGCVTPPRKAPPLRLALAGEARAPSSTSGTSGHEHFGVFTFLPLARALSAQGLPPWADDVTIPSIIPSPRSGAFCWAISQAVAPAQQGQQLAPAFRARVQRGSHGYTRIFLFSAVTFGVAFNFVLSFHLFG